MDDDQDICLCFHVSRRKINQYIRVHKPKVATQLSECFGAGTGCGWCRPYLRKMLEQINAGQPVTLPPAEKYTADRKEYRRLKR